MHIHRAALPAPEELIAGDAAPTPRGPRPGFEGSQWFRVNIGRRHNADPRWLLPFLCRRGQVSRSEIGAIRILQNETQFEVPAAAAGRFLSIARRTAREEDDGVEIIPGDGPPQGDAGRGPRGGGGRGGPRDRANSAGERPGGGGGGAPRRAPSGPRRPHNGGGRGGKR